MIPATSPSEPEKGGSPLAAFPTPPGRRPGPSLLLDELLHEMEPEMRCLARPNVNFRLENAPAPVCPIALPADEAEELIRHLLIDACDAMPDGGDLTVSLAQIIIDEGHTVHPELLPGCYVTLTVRDTGNGANATAFGKLHVVAPASMLEKGRALGLSAGYGAIQHANGSLIVSRRRSETLMRIYFPGNEGGPGESE